MIALDTNILVYALRAESPFHPAAKATLSSLLEGDKQWLLPIHVATECFAVATHPRLYKPPLTPSHAMEFLDHVLSAPTTVLGLDTRTSWDRLGELVRAADVRGPLVYDARIAAVCLANGVTELWSADRDFSRFPQLKVVNPLIKA